MDSPSPPPADAADDFISQNKRIRYEAQQPVQNHDRISTLPDDLLIKILSLMTVREAAVTDCLSNRWRHLWENTDNLILDVHTMGMQVPENHLWSSEDTEFVNKVNGVLRHHNAIGIKKFKVKFPLSFGAHASALDRWVEFAAASGSEELDVILNGPVPAPDAEPYSFPLKYFVDLSGCRLRRLILSACRLETAPANLSGFCYLEGLKLNCVSVVDSVVQNIMSCCCALRHLSLRRCHQLINVRTSHAKLVHLEFLLCTRLVSISIHAEKLRTFSYKGRKINIDYECAPVLSNLCVLFVKASECPLYFIGALPKLRTVILQFPSPVEVPCVLQHSVGFAALKEIMLCLLTSWEKSICSVVNLLKAAPRVEILKLEVYENSLQSPTELKIKWPEKGTLKRLHTIRIGGFSGEPELMELLVFLLGRSPVLKTLLIDTHRSYYKAWCNGWKREVSEDDTRCNYARELALSHLAPIVPSTVKFSAM
ncbi:hypothetical protein EJB05_14636 [Eragrostis curvula]|uniref:F-box domain-containing protein n=1 Tax=Eragrostis curvula TaxID=38414 RepID=A0A5J9W1D4_9POAL|nr:hypothetical protein EJB05_14636 [Eragrostis curvula]